ncbi:TetR/AcrR family transcriptional regulator [Promicromonospora panici]|uniref:TetR/AcrR family transcriptional regulator n=1 Tax=Promicromonospora panici TaxID=2219658 RepID=UPI0013EDE8B3|nr:TetR/AcrR family transcriptional regulator [Promicromonospora panici]
MARPVQDRTEAILAAARAQFRLDGAEHTTVDAVAARAGVGKGTVFLYWPTKARLRDAVLQLETAKLMAVLADDLRTGATHLSVGRVVRREILAVLENPDLASHVVGPFSPSSKPEQFPGRPLHRIITTMQAHGLVRDAAINEIVAGFETVMKGSLAIGFAEPERMEALLDAAERLLDSTYTRADAGPAAVAAALPEVLDALEDAIDQLVEAAAPDRPTTAVLRPRERPAVAEA